MRLLALAGEKQSGKSSTSNFLHGYIMREVGSIKSFTQDSDGNLICNTKYIDTDGSIKDGFGVLDIRRKDHEFIEYAQERIWPYVRNFGFADRLKEAVSYVFGLDYQTLYGTNEEKNSLTTIKWGDVKFAFGPYKIRALKKEGKLDSYLTHREFLEVFGSDICRKIQNSCWMDRCIESYLSSNTTFGIIDDCRFLNEAETVQKAGGKVILLTKSIFEEGEDKPVSEQILSSGIKPDLTIDNENMSQEKKNQIVLDAMYSWGWFSTQIQE